MVELAGSTAKCMSDKLVGFEISNKCWLVFDWEKHGCHTRTKLEPCRPQRIRHRRPKPRRVAGIWFHDLGIIQSVNLIYGECYSEPFTVGTLKFIFQMVSLLSLLILRWQRMRSYRIERRAEYWFLIMRASSGRVIFRTPS